MTGCSGEVKESQEKIEKLSTSEITRISLKHYDKVIEVDVLDPNFNEIIELTSKMKLKSKYSGGLLMGGPLYATFYDKDLKILEIDTGIAQTIVDGVMFNTAKDSEQIARKLDTILGAYYGYDQ